MTRARWLWPAVALVVMIACAFAVHRGARALGARSVAAQLVVLRQAVFARITEDHALFRAEPDALVAAGFLRDEGPRPPALLRAAVTSTAADPLQTALTLLHQVPWRNSPFCMIGRSLEEKSRGLRAGKTCCSDNVELFVGQLAMEGVFAREVHTTRHVIAEVFVPKLEGWVLIDPSYGVMAFAPDDRPLSLLELRARMLDGQPYELRFVGGELARDGKATPQQIDFYASPEEMETVSLVLGNNVFDVDRSRTGGRMPEAVRQAVGLIGGSEPATVVLSDARSKDAHEIAALRPPLFGFAASGVWLAALGVLRLRRRARGV